MPTYDLVLIGSTLCSIVLVVGGILLLYKGAIKFEVASKDPALTLEIFEKRFKLTTHVPALGIFIIGLIFAGGAIYFGLETIAKPIEIRGLVISDNEEARVKLHSDWMLTAHNGEVNDVTRPKIDVLWIEISAPGYAPYETSYTKDQFENGIINFGEVTLKRVMERIEPNSSNIINVPPGLQLPPFTTEGSFDRGVNP